LKHSRERTRFGKEPLPEIILTAYDDAQVREEARELGVEIHLKPLLWKSSWKSSGGILTDLIIDLN